MKVLGRKKSNICIGSMNSWFKFQGRKIKLMYSKLVIILDVKVQGRKQLNRVVSLINIISPI